MDYGVLKSQRGKFGKTIVICGDSIAGGYALGTWGVPLSHPLYRLRSPASTLEFLLAAQPDICVTTGPTLISGSPNGNPNLSPYVSPDTLREMFLSGTLRPGDVLVIEDAGPHPLPQWYHESLSLLIGVLEEYPYVTTLISTTPDYAPAPIDSQWDLPQDGVAINDVIASLAVPGTAPIYCIDWNESMDATRPYMLGQWGIDPFLADGIHPNVWGQLDLCRNILLGSQLLSKASTVELRNLLKDNRTLVNYGSPYCTYDCVDDLVNRLVKHE